MSSNDSTPPILGLRHLALYVADARYEATKRFYIEGMGMTVDWQPDEDAIYLSGGTDNLALHRVPEVSRLHPALDHLGFICPTHEAVEAWYARLEARVADFGIELLNKPRVHRDASSSFYLLDPAGNKVQIVCIPSCV